MEAPQDRQVDAIKRILSQRTPPGEIRVRDGRGGAKLKYTDGAYVIRTLNEALGWDWDFVADNEELLMNGDKPFEVKVRGTLTVRMDGRAITKTQFGCQPIEMLRDGSKPVSIGDAYKGAATDAMKKCASLLGIALDLYDSDYRPEKYEEAPPVKQVKSEVAQPTDDEPNRDLPTELCGAAGHVVALAAKLKWDSGKLSQVIEDKFKVIIAPNKVKDWLEFAQAGELRELYRTLQTKQNGGRK